MTSRAKDRFPNYESICLQCGATIYKPYREVTDEEILDLCPPNHSEMMNEAYTIEFARAILRKASEK